MRSRLLGFLIVLILIGVAIIALELRPALGPEVSPALSPEAGAVCARPEARVISMVDSPDSRGERVEISRSGLEGAALSAHERRPFSQPEMKDRRGLRVLVVERESGRPIHGAEVRGASTRDLVMFDVHRPRWQPPPDELLASIPTEAIADERGEAWLSIASVPALVDARFHDRWGSTWIEQDSVSPIQVEIDLDRELAVQVVDDAGKPVVGIPVGVGTHANQPDLWIDDTRGAIGVARLRHVDHKVFRYADGVQASAHLAILAHHLERVPIDLDALPVEPIRLVSPPTGSVEVRLVGEDGGRIFPHSIQLSEGTVVSAEGEPIEPVGPPAVPVRIDEGGARYAHVGLGLDLVACATAAGYKPSGIHAIGPRTAGEHVVIRLSMPALDPFVVVRLVDEQRTPLVDRQLEMNVSSRSGAPISQGIATDARGELRIPSISSESSPWPAFVSLKLDAHGPCADCGASFAFPNVLHAGDNGLGDVVLRPRAVLCSGSVVDELGALVRGAEISRQVDSDELTYAPWTPSTWTVWDARGTFELRGDTPRGMMHLCASAEGHVRGSPIDVAPGARDVRLVVARGCELSGSVLYDKSIKQNDIRVYLRRTRVSGPNDGEVGTDELSFLDEDGSFAFDSLRSGTVDVRVEWNPTGEELASIPRVDLALGSGARDPRLKDIDVRPFHLLHVTVVDEAGATVTTGRVTAKSGAEPARSYRFHSGEVPILARGPTTDLEIRCYGFHVAHEHSVGAEMRVVLARGIRIQLKLPDGFEMPEDPLYLGLELNLFGEEPIAEDPLDNDFFSDPAVGLGLQEPGRYEVRWRLRELGGQNRLWPLANARPLSIVVGESDRERVFIVAPDPIELADGLRAAGSPR